MQKGQTLGLQCLPQQTHARNVAPRPVKARDDADHDWIAGADKDNRNLRGCRLGYRRRWGIRGDHGHLMTYKIGSHSLEAIVLTPSPPVIHHDIFTLDVTDFHEPMEKPDHVRCVSVW